MKRLFLLVITLCLMGFAYSQDREVSDQISSYDATSGTKVINEDIVVRMVANEDIGYLPEDSAKYEYVDRIYQKRIVRLETEAVYKSFPEVVSITTEGDSIIDYISLIPILMNVVKDQNQVIEELSKRLSLIEDSTRE